MQVTDSSGNIFGPNGLQVNGSDGKPKVISSGGGGGSIPHGTASGTDTYTVSISGVTSYADGDAYLVRFTNGNTTGSTLNINGLGAITMYRNNDGQLIGGDIEDGAEMLCVYNSTLNVFQVIGTSPNTLLAYVTNAEAITITKGQPVYAFGGQGDRLKVKLAYNTSDATSAQTVGLVLSTSIGANQKGFIILNGQLDGLSILPTSTWADGDPVYLGATAGSITKTKPHAPNHLVYLGFVTTANNGSAGRMYVRVQNGYELDELHDVQISGLADNDLLQYDLATDLWQNKSLSGAGIQSTLSLTTTGTSGAATLVGSTLNIPQYGGGLTVGTTAISSGTVGRILFEGTGNVLQESANLFWDNTNSRLGIGTATPSALLHTVGSVTASGGAARGNYMQPTLVAAANNDVMVGLDILPTYTPGVFTGTNNIALRANGRVIIGTSTDTTSSYPPTLYVQSNNALFAAAPAHGGLWVQQNNTGNFAAATFFGNSLINQFMIGRTGSAYSGMATKSFLHSSGNDIWITASASGSPDPANHVMLMFQATRNVAINSTTDAGFKLDVNGTARVSSFIDCRSYGSFRGDFYVYQGNGGGGFSITQTAGQSYLIGQSTHDMIMGRVGGYSFILKNQTRVFGMDDTTSSALTNASALLTMTSTTKGFLPPRMTNAQMLAIAAPAAGLVVYDTTNNKHVGYDGTAWQNFY